MTDDGQGWLNEVTLFRKTLIPVSKGYLVMNRNVLKAAALAVVAGATLAAPAAQAGGYKHKGFHFHSPVIVKHYGYRHYYRPVVVYKVVEPTCYKYKWVWKHGYKHKVCVDSW